jgi:hypothetical protein
MRPLGGLVSVISKARGVPDCISPSVDLPIHHWRFAGRGRQPKDGAAYEGTAEQVACLIFVILERNAKLYLCTNHLFFAFVHSRVTSVSSTGASVGAFCERCLLHRSQFPLPPGNHACAVLASTIGNLSRP